MVYDNEKFELTTLRKDVKTDGRHAVIEKIDNWEETLKEETLLLMQFI